MKQVEQELDDDSDGEATCNQFILKEALVTSEEEDEDDGVPANDSVQFENGIVLEDISQFIVDAHMKSQEAIVEGMTAVASLCTDEALHEMASLMSTTALGVELFTASHADALRKIRRGNVER